jgi:hypothetical protein
LRWISTRVAKPPFTVALGLITMPSDIEPVKAAHVACRIDAAKIHGGHGCSLEIVQRLTL